MPIIIEVGGTIAAYIKGHWKAKNPGNDAFMKHLDDLMKSADGPGGDDPYPDLTRTKRIVEELRGRLIDEGKPPKTKAGVVY